MTVEVRWGKISEGEEALELSMAQAIHKFGTGHSQIIHSNRSRAERTSGV